MQRAGTAHVIGDGVDTDQIIPGKYLHLDDKQEFGSHALEGYDPDLAARIEPGDIIVAGANLGLGSSREAAPLALRYAGVGAVVADSFARIFYRNCINVGLPIAEVPEITAAVDDGDELVVDLGAGLVTNTTTGAEFTAGRLPPRLQSILEAGGLVAYRTGSSPD
jgi:3-isopropylmalate dehydratase, small subunit